MLQKLTLSLSEEGVLLSYCYNTLSLHHPPYMLLMSGHCDFLPLPTNHCETLMLHLCRCWHCHTAANSTFALQLLLNCCCCYYNYSNWEVSKILNQLYLVLHMSPKSWLLLASALSTRNLHCHWLRYWAPYSTANTALRSSIFDCN